MRQRVIRGARAGMVGAAAAAGALVSFGLRQGTPARPFNALAILALGDRARGVWGFDALVSLTGAILLLVACAIVGVILSPLADEMSDTPRRAKPALLAFILSLALGVATVVLVSRTTPDLIGPVPSGALSLTQAVVVTVLLSAGFASGMRLAR